MIKTMDILLFSVDAVKSFVNVVGNMPGGVTIVSGRYVIDAKSIMGIFSLDLSKPMNLEIEEWKDEYMDKLDPFVNALFCSQWFSKCSVGAIK